MGKLDVLDREAARRMAWSRELPDDAEEALEPSAEPVDPAELSRRREANAERVARLAQLVEEVWAIPSPDLQARAVGPLAERVAASGFGLAAMSGANTTPRLRLARLIVRHYRSLPVSARRRALWALSFAPTGGSELPDLLVETALLGDSWASFTVGRLVGEAMHLAHPSLGAKLAVVVGGAPSYESRRTALFWLSAGTFPDAIPTLRGCLRGHYIGFRWAALSILLDLRSERPRAESVTPIALIAPDDIAWLLEDAVVHPPSCEIEDRAQQDGVEYEKVLLRAVRELRPADGEKPLMRIARGDCAHWNKMRDSLGRGWAVRALAAGYPERATGIVDETLRNARANVREDGARALADLRWEDAEPRLRMAGVDPSPRVAEVARGIFEKRSGKTWSSHPLDGLPLELLDAPPSDSLVERVTVIRVQGPEGRDATAAVLLGEAPSREALVATLLLLAEGTVVYAKREGLPRQGDWAPALVERWGEAGARGLLWLARRYPVGLGEWVHPLIDVVGSPAGSMIADDARALALDLLRIEGAHHASAMSLLSAAGGVSATTWRAAWEELGDPSSAWMAARALVACEPCAELDAHLVAEAPRALGEGDAERFETIARVGLERGIAGMADIVQRALAESELDLGSLASIAWERGLIDAAWRSEALRHPESVRFAAAVSRLPDRKRASRKDESALRDALRSMARKGAASVDAALGLLRTGALSVGDAELLEVLDRAPLAARVPLIERMAWHVDGAVDALWKHVEPILRTTDVAAQEALLNALFSHLSENEWAERVRPILEAMPEGEPREILACGLREPNAAVRYWLDPPAAEGREEGDDG